MIISVKIDKDLSIRNEVDYLLRVLGNNKSVKFIEDAGGIGIGTSQDSHIRISERFVSNLQQRKFSFAENLNSSGYIILSTGEVDYLSTAFYMLASLQEYNSSGPLDSLGRFQFSQSYQAELNLSTSNIVQHCFDKLAEKLRIPSCPKPTRFFLSHDIDTVYESILQDGFHVLKKGRFDIFFRLLLNVAMQKPDWLNMDQIMNIESKYDCRSTFFWIARKGKEGKLKNADYSFSSEKIQRIVKSVERNRSENGIHKSASGSTFQEEMKAFQKPPLANRYHYLKFNLPGGFDALEESGLKIDSSLGFAENIGFRNNYGLPYNPFNVKERKPYHFVEIPLHVMDTTLFKYRKSNIDEAEKEIFSFFEKNRENCVLSILWHNNFFSHYKYKGYLPLYKKILAYIRENNFTTITQREIIEQYTLD